MHLFPGAIVIFLKKNPDSGKFFIVLTET